MIKKIFFFLIVFTIFSQKSFSSAKEKVINNFIKINNISFEFQQRIDDKIEVGKCYIKYPKLIYCLYDNKNKKEMVSNGKGLVIKNNRQNKNKTAILNIDEEDIVSHKLMVKSIKEALWNKYNY